MNNYLLFYCFDWDNNILHMPTKIILLNIRNEEVEMSTEDFVNYRELIGVENFEYNGEKISDFPRKNGKVDMNSSFRNFRDIVDPNIFLKDTIKAINNQDFGPSWKDFIECLVRGTIFSIITARGNEGKTIRNTVEHIIDNYLSEEEQQLMYNNLLNFAHQFRSRKEFERILNGDPSKTYLVQNYLNHCDFVGISSPSMGGSPENPEEMKEKSLLNFRDKVMTLAHKIGAKAKIGISDDDHGNINHINQLIRNLHHGSYGNIIEYIVKNTNDPGNIDTTVHKLERYTMKYLEAADSPFNGEFRLNIFKNFNHFNKDQLGAMEVFGKRSADEVIKLNKEDIFPGQADTGDQTHLPDHINPDQPVIPDDVSYPQDDDDGLVINGDDRLGSMAGHAKSTYPYGFGSQPNPTFQDDTGLRGPGNRQVMTFEQFIKK